VQSWLLSEELCQALSLGGVKPVVAGAQQTEPAAMPGQIRAELAGESEQVLKDQSHGMETISHNRGAGKPASNQSAVRRGQIDADHAHPVAAAQGAQEGPQLGFAAARTQIKHSAILQIAKGRGETLVPMQGMFVDAQDPGTIDAEPLLGLALGELGVDPAHRGLADVGSSRQGGRADPIVVALINCFPQRFGAVASRHNPRQRLHKTASTIYAAVATAVDAQVSRTAKAIEVAHPTFISALAVEPAGSTARADGRCLQHLQIYPQVRIALHPDHAVSRKR